MRALVIGIGNTLRGDDGAGARVAEAVAASVPDVDTVAVHQLVPELVDTIKDHDRVYFVDASVTAAALTSTPIEPAIASLDAHDWSPGGLLSLARDLYGAYPRAAMLVEIPASEFGFGAPFSAAAQQAVDEAVAHIISLEQSRATPVG